MEEENNKTEEIAEETKEGKIIEPEVIKGNKEEHVFSRFFNWISKWTIMLFFFAACIGEAVWYVQFNWGYSFVLATMMLSMLFVLVAGVLIFLEWWRKGIKHSSLALMIVFMMLFASTSFLAFMPTSFSHLKKDKYSTPVKNYSVVTDLDGNFIGRLPLNRVEKNDPEKYLVYDKWYILHYIKHRVVPGVPFEGKLEYECGLTLEVDDVSRDIVLSFTLPYKVVDYSEAWKMYKEKDKLETAIREKINREVFPIVDRFSVSYMTELSTIKTSVAKEYIDQKGTKKMVEKGYYDVVIAALKQKLNMPYIAFGIVSSVCIK